MNIAGRVMKIVCRVLHDTFKILPWPFQWLFYVSVLLVVLTAGAYIWEWTTGVLLFNDWTGELWGTRIKK